MKEKAAPKPSKPGAGSPPAPCAELKCREILLCDLERKGREEREEKGRKARERGKEGKVNKNTEKDLGNMG